MSDLIFLKLGGSLITDKTSVEAMRHDVLARLATEIAAARKVNPQLKLLFGHGSGSFGHVAAAKYGTRHGIGKRDDLTIAQQWHGFAEVSSAASRISKIVTDALLAAGIPAVSLQPAASAICEDGQIVEMALNPIKEALEVGLVPVIHGDVAFDRVKGGTIISTEEIMTFLAQSLKPTWLLLAGETTGVLDLDQEVIPQITPTNLADVVAALGGSHGTDVTGGMATKVHGMLALAEQFEGLSIRIFSGLPSGNLEKLLLAPQKPIGTHLTS